jgi:ABC-2 type transport system permease protein
LKTVAIHTPAAPPPNPYLQQLGMPPQPGKQFRILQEKLSENYKLINTDLSSGRIAEATDLLLLVAPDNLDEKQLFAIDQFLMKGGAVVLVTAPFQANLSRGNLAVTKHNSGLDDWLNHHGIRIQQQLVLDPQNAMLPIPVNRDLGGFSVQEIQMVEYPYFVDIRHSGMSDGGAMTAGLPQITMNWAAPISVTEHPDMKFTRLLQSSEAAWLSDSTQMVPDYNRYGDLGFEAAAQREKYLLGAVVEGRFSSFFKGKKSPLLTVADDANLEENEHESDAQTEDILRIGSVIEKSPESARIIVFASNEFLTDQTIQLAATAGGVEYINSLQLVENAVDWSLEDRGLLSIRSRSHFSRTLFPLSSQEQAFWEYLNYGLSLLGVLLVYLVYRLKRLKTQRYYDEILQCSGEQS